MGARHAAVAATVCCLLAASCSGGRDDVSTDRATTTGPGASTTTGRHTSTTGGEATSTTAPEPTTSTSPGTGDGGSGSTPTSAPGTTAPATSAPGTSAPPTTASGGPRPLGEVRLRVRAVGSFSVPTVYRAHPSGAAYVGEKAGRVRDVSTGATALDIRDRVIDQGERGFLGMAFDATGRRLYVSYSDAASGGDSVVAEYAFAGGRADEATRRVLLRLEQPYANHNGGDVHLGPDGYLYVAFGDGGSGGDPHEHGQNPATLLGSILRIDPTRPGAGRPYGIPAGNPFAAAGGAPEVYLHGVRNPWRISFDPATTDLWVADVGQDAWEEITVLPAPDRGRGANLGWNHLEGTHRHAGGGTPAAYRAPVFEYPHSQGCSITGGHVYRGAAIPELRGAYLFADLCRTTLRALRADGTSLVEQRVFDVDVGTPISFGVEPSGELVVLSQEGTVYRVERG